MEEKSRKGKAELITEIMSSIKQTIVEDSKERLPLFLSIKENFIANLLRLVIIEKKKSLVISITGESASGKTTFVQNAIKSHPSSNKGGIYTTIDCDDYYFDISRELKEKGGYEALFASGYSFDTPDAINLNLMREHLLKLKNGESIYSPEYDFVTCASKPNAKLKEPALLILNEGLFVLNENLADVSDVKVYIHTPFDLIKERWYKRAGSRGKTGKAADMQFETVNQAAEKYIRPTLIDADVVLNGQTSPEYISRIVNKIFHSIREITLDASF